MKGHLESLRDTHPGFHLQVCYGEPAEEDVLGIDYQHQGWLDIRLLQRTLHFGRYEFYVCGPPPMMEALVPALEASGVAPADIHYESFGPASLTDNDGRPNPGGGRHAHGGALQSIGQDHPVGSRRRVLARTGRGPWHPGEFRLPRRQLRQLSDRHRVRRGQLPTDPGRRREAWPLPALYHAPATDLALAL